MSCGAASRDLFLNRFVVLLISQKDYEHFMLRVSFCISILVYAYILMYCFKHHGFCAVVRRPKNPKHKTQLVLAEDRGQRTGFRFTIVGFWLRRRQQTISASLQLMRQSQGSLQCCHRQEAVDKCQLLSQPGANLWP